MSISTKIKFNLSFESLCKSHVWIISELLDTSLDRFYKKAFKLKIEIPELFMSKVAYAVLKGLEFMRSQNLMHRDIKPSNILLNYDGDIKLCDFGISGNFLILH
jgi:serine/threonine protein kinase